MVPECRTACLSARLPLSRSLSRVHQSGCFNCAVRTSTSSKIFAAGLHTELCRKRPWHGAGITGPWVSFQICRGSLMDRQETQTPRHHVAPNELNWNSVSSLVASNLSGACACSPWLHGHWRPKTFLLVRTSKVGQAVACDDQQRCSSAGGCFDSCNFPVWDCKFLGFFAMEEPILCTTSCSHTARRPFQDPPRPGVREAVEKAQIAGVKACASVGAPSLKLVFLGTELVALP